MTASNGRQGPLTHLKIVEFAGIGPAPMCAMLLADLGATVLRIESRKAVDLGTKKPLEFDVLRRGRETIALDLKAPEGLAVALELVDGADALIEGFRPGVMERLGLGPDVCLKRNPRLVYGRMTGWGQTGPMAHAAGHDLNYIAITGALAAIGRKGQPPSVPLNVLGDFGGGAMYLALGLLAGISHAREAGQGQVVDASIVDGTLSLMAMHFGTMAAGLWQSERGSNVIDSGAPFYDVYECADGKWISIAPIERRFFLELLKRLDIDAGPYPDHFDRGSWDGLRERLAGKFISQPQAHWCALLEGTDACFAPVLSMAEVPGHPHVMARESLIVCDGVLQPASAPRFSKTPGAIGKAPGLSTDAQAQEHLAHWFGQPQYQSLTRQGVLSAAFGTATANSS